MAGSHRREKREAAAGLFDRWLSHRQPAVEPALDVEDKAEEAAVAPSAHATPPPPGPSTNVDFTPRTRARRLVGLVLLIALVGAAVATYAVYRNRTTLTIGLAVTLGVLVIIIWAVRAGSPPPRLSVRAGQLEVVQAGGRFVFDLSGGYTPIEVVGRPGDRGWKVLFLRRNMDPFVIDSSMVDPHEFMKVLRRYRPD
jgi:hypothetical protein